MYNKVYLSTYFSTFHFAGVDAYNHICDRSRSMHVVTLTSDLGLRDYYVAAIKGAILTKHQAPVQFVDISHQIKSFDIKEAAYVVKNAYRYFPKGSVHIIHTRGNATNSKLLACEVDGHYFVTYNNGVLPIMFYPIPGGIYEVNAEITEVDSLLSENGLAQVVHLLLQEFKLPDFAHPAHDYTDSRLINPTYQKDFIKGSVVHIDSFGNVVTNISRQLFDEYIGNKSFLIESSIAIIQTISKHYQDVEEGDVLALFNSQDLLEIAMNRSKAANLLGIKLNSNVIVTAR